MIPAELRAELENRVAAAVTPREAAVDVMKAVQGHYGWLSDAGVREAAEILGLSPLEVEELATFYDMIYRRPVGRHVIHICDSVSCWSVGGETLMAQLLARLGVAAGEVTPDGLFTVLPCACLGNCGEGPAAMIGGTLYGRIDPTSIETLLAEAREEIPGPAISSTPEGTA